jgi:hypothetical protein
VRFDIALSIGYNCQPRYQITRIVEGRVSAGIGLAPGSARPMARRGYGTHFWDWSITPIQGAVRTLREGFGRTFLRENLTIEPGPTEASQNSVVDAYTGFKYLHEFTRSDGRITEEAIEREYPVVRAKFLQLATKTTALLDSRKRILFVRYGPSRPSEVQELLDALLVRTADPWLLFLPYGVPDFEPFEHDASDDQRALSRP